jgi:hypothetical protein
MARRTAGVLMAALLWGATATAGAQTSTTSSSSTTSTSSTSTTSTTRANPCTGQPCTADPPVATLSGSAGDVRLDPFGYCWREIVGDLTRCQVPALALDIPVGMVLRSGETLTLRFATTLLPSEVVLQSGGQRTALTPTNPTSFVVDLPVGVQIITFQTQWFQGDVSYFLKVDVRAQTQPRVLTLTG